MRWPVGVGVALLGCLVLGCGGDTAHGRATGTPDAGVDGRADGDVRGVAGLCPSAGWTDPDLHVLLGMDDEDRIVVLKADGSREVLLDPGIPEDIAAWGWSFPLSDDITGLGAWWGEGSQTMLRGVVLTPGGELLWTYEHEVDERISLPYVAEPSRHGLAIHGDLATHVLYPDGTTEEAAPANIVRSGPDADGWIKIYGDDFRLGWVRGGLSEPRLTTHVPLPRPDTDSGPGSILDLPGSGYIYLAASGQAVSLFSETPETLEPLREGLPADATFDLVSNETGYYVVVQDGLPRWAYSHAAHETVSLEIPAGSSPSTPNVQLGDAWALVMDGAMPVWTVNLETGNGFSIDAASLDPVTVNGEVEIQAANHWFMGADAVRPLWVVDAESGAVRRPELDPDLGWRWFEQPGTNTSCRVESWLLSDGRVAAALRGGAARVGVNSEDGSWNWVGHRMSDISTVEMRQVEDTFVIETRSAETCQPNEPWPPVLDDDTVLLGNYVQVVAPNAAAPLVLEGTPLIQVNKTGRCAHDSNQVYDLVTLEETDYVLHTGKWLQ
jgi:hypothetical protein